MSNKKLIINADDFGYTPAVTQGIIEAHKRGVVTSTTALPTSPYFLLLIFPHSLFCFMNF